MGPHRYPLNRHERSAPSPRADSSSPEPHWGLIPRFLLLDDVGTGSVIPDRQLQPSVSEWRVHCLPEVAIPAWHSSHRSVLPDFAPSQFVGRPGLLVRPPSARRKLLKLP